MPRTVHIQSLGCARNDVDSEELAGRLAAEGFQLVAEPADAETVVVNTCGFVDHAKKDSVDTLLAAADLKAGGTTRAVVAVGCLAERYGVALADALPEADAVLGFDDYPAIADRLRSVLAGSPPAPPVPRDRRLLLPVAPTARPAAARAQPVPGHGTAGQAPSQRATGPRFPSRPTRDRPDPGLSAMAPRLGGAVAGQQIPDLPPGVAPPSGPRALRVRLGSGPTAPVKLASGCDRRCTFCAIPAFRGSFLSRRPEDVLADTQWLASQGVREIFLVSENTTSYGKDLGDLTLLESLLADLVAVPGVARLRLSYLQPAELRPALLAAIATTPGVAPYFDLSFQHASAPVLRRMRRHGDAGRFLDLLAEIRRHEPRAGVRSNVIVGFPGETEADLRVLEDFLAAARLDAVGVFGYSDEDGTAAARLPGKVHPDEVAQRVERVTSLGEDLMEQRGDERVGEPVDVLVESLAAGGRGAGRAAHQGPEVDGDVELSGLPRSVRVGDVVAATVRSGGPAGCLAAVATRADGAHPLR